MIKQLLATSVLVTATVLLSDLPAQSQSQSLSPSFVLEHLDPDLAQSKQNNSPDPRVRQALNSLSLRYSIEDSGAYRVTINYTQESRSQTGIIFSSTSAIGSLEIRTIASLAYVHNGPLPADLARRLLDENNRRPLGAWRTLELEGGRIAVLYAAYVDANAAPEDLRSTLREVLASADRLEEELSDRDQF